MKPEYIRNFSIIAHIDHGKSTLADRILEFTGTLSEREMCEQVLDTMELERERGITIKAQTVQIHYTADSGTTYILNLIDTPGHVDFSYEVSRSLKACEGALLVVDASQGVEAQTLANTYLAIEHDLEIIPVINKIDLPSANPAKVMNQIEEVLGIDTSHTILTSAKEGIGIKEVLNAIVERIPPPSSTQKNPLRALIFDSKFDSYQGSVITARIFDNSIQRGMKILMMSSGKTFEVTRVGVFTPYMTDREELFAGEVGYIIAGIKEVKDTRIGDTVTDAARPASEPLSGFKEMKPMVFAGLYPVDNTLYENLRNALEKLSLNDSSFCYEPETSGALGFGFRCGFLGLLHMDIIRERLEREFDLSLLVTAPTVIYRVHKTSGDQIEIDNPSSLPEPQLIESIEEPFIRSIIILPADFVGAILKLIQEKRGIQKGIEYLSENRVLITAELPFTEIIFDFYDRLKSVTRGYASLDYELLDYRKSNLVKLDLLINGQPVDALSSIIHRDRAYYRGRELANQMKKLIPRQMFEVAIQAAIGNKVIARETISALRKNVTAKCYGGDITRKRKLIEKQKEGKKRMKRIGKVDIPQEAFMAVLSTDKK